MSIKLPRFAVAALAAATMAGAPLAANAQNYHHDHGGWNGGGDHYDHHNYGGDRGDYRGDRDRGGIGAGGVLLGLGLGALIGGAIVSSQQPQYAPPPQYYAPPPPVYYAPPPPAYYAPPPGAYSPY